MTRLQSTKCVLAVMLVCLALLFCPTVTASQSLFVGGRLGVGLLAEITAVRLFEPPTGRPQALIGFWTASIPGDILGRGKNKFLLCATARNRGSERRCSPH